MEAAGGNRSDAGARKAPARRRVPGWVPLVVLLSVAVWLVGRIGATSATGSQDEVAAAGPPDGRPAISAADRTAASLAAADLAAESASAAEDEPFGVVDPHYVRLDGYSGFVDDRWRTVLAARLASLPEADADDPEALEPIRAALLRLPFVAEVGVGSVLWPDGYRVAVRLRKPEACVHTPAGYFLVDAEGVVLPGEWKRPPWVAGGWLPVLGPLEDPPRGGDASLRAGGRIAERRHLDALSVAVSMRTALAAEDFETLGAPVIDATDARGATVEKPGVVLELEEGRRVLFGRAPNAGEPGELPVEKKWTALAKAARALRQPSGERSDWSLLDVRWDVPDVLWRDPSEAPPKLAANPPPAPAASSPEPKLPAPRLPAPSPSPATSPAPSSAKAPTPPKKPASAPIPARSATSVGTGTTVDPPRDPPTNKPRVL